MVVFIIILIPVVIVEIHINNNYQKLMVGWRWQHSASLKYTEQLINSGAMMSRPQNVLDL